MDCLFCKIIDGKIPSKKIYEDDQVFAFHDINPQAPVHFLVIPKKHIATLNDVTEDDRAVVGHMVYVAQKLANELGCERAFAPCSTATKWVARRSTIFTCMYSASAS